MRKALKKPGVLAGILVIGLLAGVVYCADWYKRFDLGTKQPGDVVSAVAKPPGKILTSGVTNYDGWPWFGSLGAYRATVPPGWAGTHSSQFDGTYEPKGGGGDGKEKTYTWEMDVTANGGLALELTGEDIIPIGVEKTYTAKGFPTGGTYEWKITPISGAATIDTSTGIMKGTQAGEVFVEVT